MTWGRWESQVWISLHSSTRKKNSLKPKGKTRFKFSPPSESILHIHILEYTSFGLVKHSQYLGQKGIAKSKKIRLIYSTTSHTKRFTNVINRTQQPSTPAHADDCCCTGKKHISHIPFCFQMHLLKIFVMASLFHYRGLLSNRGHRSQTRPNSVPAFLISDRNW